MNGVSEIKTGAPIEKFVSYKGETRMDNLSFAAPLIYCDAESINGIFIGTGNWIYLIHRTWHVFS